MAHLPPGPGGPPTVEFVAPSADATVLAAEGQQLAEELRRTRAQLSSLLEASLAVVSSLTLHDVLQTVLAGVRTLFEARAAAIWRRDDSGRLRRLASSGLSRAYTRQVSH